jgi:GMP synthase (glutamine-hydrolysing)
MQGLSAKSGLTRQSGDPPPAPFDTITRRRQTLGPMSLLVFQHEATEGPAVLGQILQTYGHKLRTVKLHQGDAVPPDFDDVDGVISLGGAANVDETAKYPWLAAEMDYLKQAHQRGLGVVGICLGAQMIAKALGGEVAAMPAPEVGWHPVRMAFPGTIDPAYAGLTWNRVLFHLHGQEVTKLPAGAAPLSGSKLCKTQAFKLEMKTYAFQYHFEWSRADIERMVQDDLVKKAGVNPADILRQSDEHYDSYRRQGDRLCHTIANLLFPIDKR